MLVIEIANEVDAGMASYVERTVAQAEKDHAVILLHVNTARWRAGCCDKDPGRDIECESSTHDCVC